MRQKIKIETIILLVFVSLAIGLTACATHPNVDWKLKISGAVNKPLVLNYADLARMPQTELKELLMQKTTSEDTINTWVGVPLDDIASKAGADPQYAAIPILMLTSIARDTGMDFTPRTGGDLKQLNVDDFSAKPIKAQVLLEKVEKLLAKKSKRGKK